MSGNAKTELIELSIDEGSLVDAGDNPEAHITLFKRAPAVAAKERGPRTFQQVVAERELTEEFHEARSAFECSVWEILSGADVSVMGPLLARSAEEFSSAVADLGLDDMAKQIGDAVAAAAKETTVEQMRDGINKALSALPGPAEQTPEEDVSEKNKPTAATKTFDEILAALPEAERAVVSARMADAEQEKTAAKAKADEAAEKAKVADDLAKRLDTLEKRAADAEAEVAKMKDEKLTQHFTTKAREIGGGDVAKMATMLKAAYGRSEEEGKTLEDMLRGMAAQAKLGSTLFKSLGSEAPGAADDSPEAVIESATKRIMEADPKLGYHAAYKLALAQNRDAYQRSIGGRSVE